MVWLVRRLRRQGCGELLDAAEFGTVRREQGLPTLGDEERAGAVDGEEDVARDFAEVHARNELLACLETRVDRLPVDSLSNGIREAPRVRC